MTDSKRENNHSDNRSGAKRTIMKVRNGGVTVVDAEKNSKNKTSENEKVNNNGQ